MGTLRYNLRERKTSGRTAEGETKGKKKGTARSARRAEDDGTKGVSVQGTRKRRAVEIEAPPTEKSPDEREVKRPRTPERCLPTPESEDSKPKESTPSPTSIQTNIPADAGDIPPEHNRLAEESRSPEHAILEAPFEYTPTERGKSTELPPILEVEPEFARVLEYIAPENPGSTSPTALNLLAGVASRTLSELSNPIPQESTPTNFGNESNSTISVPIGPPPALDMQEIIPGLYLGS